MSANNISTMSENTMHDISGHNRHISPSIISRPKSAMRKKNSEKYCCRCFHKRRISTLTCTGICILLLMYLTLGGFIFLATESPKSYVRLHDITPSIPHTAQIHLNEAVRLKTVERLWTITEDLNILYKKNWTKLADKELTNFHKVVLESLQKESAEQQKEYRWTFADSFLYALTLITTIGNGNIRPTSLTGTVVAIAYASLGIPIIILYLSTIGEIFARKFRSLYYKICPKSIQSKNFHSKADCRSNCRCHIIDNSTTINEEGEINEPQVNTPFHAVLNSNGEFHWMCRDHTRVPIIFSILLLVIYVSIGSYTFQATEDWNLIDAFYFSFSVLATIGFGYFKPGSHASSISTHAEDFAIGVCCVYILFGAVMIAMCFNLIQDDLGQSLRELTSFSLGNSKSRVIYNIEAAGDSAPVPVI